MVDDARLTVARQALFDLMDSDDDLADLTTGIYHRVAPQGAIYPFVVFHRHSGRPLWAFAGDPTNDETWLIKGVCKGPSSTIAEQVDDVLQAILNDAELDIDGQATLYLRRDQDIDYAEQDGADTIHHVGCLYRLVRE